MYDAVFNELSVEVFLHRPEFGFNFNAVESQILNKLLSFIEVFLILIPIFLVVHFQKPILSEFSRQFLGF